MRRHIRAVHNSTGVECSNCSLAPHAPERVRIAPIAVAAREHILHTDVRGLAGIAAVRERAGDAAVTTAAAVDEVVRAPVAATRWEGRRWRR